jgi:hypothetical protein
MDVVLDAVFFGLPVVDFVRKLACFAAGGGVFEVSTAQVPKIVWCLEEIWELC